MLRDSGTPHILLMLCLYWVLYNHYVINKTCINPLALGNFAEKHILKQVELFSGYCLAIRSSNLQKIHLQVVHFVALCFRCQISASKVWASAQKAKFSVLGVKVIQRSRLSPFAFSNSFAFLASWFFFVCLFAGNLLGFTLVEKAFGKAFRFFDGKKGTSCTIFAFFLRNPWFSLAHSGAGWGHLSI